MTEHYIDNCIDYITREPRPEYVVCKHCFAAIKRPDQDRHIQVHVRNGTLTAVDK